MEDILSKRKEIFFNNLVLLGLDRALFEKKHGIAFHRDMFVLPNKKGYEVVTHFLFSKLSSTTGKDYNMPWPLLCKEHDRDFQKTCYSHLTNFSQENCVKFPRIVPSLLSTFGGDRFYEVYFAFSCYVLYKTVKKNGNIKLLSRPLTNPETVSTAKEFLQLSTVLHMKKFRDTVNATYTCHSLWIKFVKNLEDCLKKFKHLLKFHESLLKENKEIISSLLLTVPEKSFDLTKMIERTADFLKPVLKQRKVLDNFFAADQKYWHYLSSEVGENAENEFLDGEDHNIIISESVSEQYPEFKNLEYHSSKENGKLSVFRFIKIFMTYLKSILELLEKINFSELQKSCFVEDASSIEDDLHLIESLNKKLTEEVIPGLSESTQKLKIVKCFDAYEENLELPSDQFCRSLTVLSFGIEAILERTSHFDQSLKERLLLPTAGKQICSQNFEAVSSIKKDDSDLSFLVDESIGSSDLSFSNSEVFYQRRATVNSDLRHKVNERNATDSARISNVPVMDPSLRSEDCSNMKLNISALGDLDFAPSAEFKMRGSWLQEESLETMTLPDMSFDD